MGNEREQKKAKIEPPKSAKDIPKGSVYVSGYTRFDGTFVPGHYR